MVRYSETRLKPPGLRTFHEILPYAQALDVTTIWCDKFNGIDVKPSNSHGHSSISGDVVRVSNKLENTMTKSVASKSSSGSSGGSSGGFSGGGSGGGGGRSW